MQNTLDVAKAIVQEIKEHQAWVKRMDKLIQEVDVLIDRKILQWQKK